MMTYVRKDLLSDISEEQFSSVENLLRLISDCLKNPDMFHQHAKLEGFPQQTTAANFFLSCFPGFLLQAYKVITWDDLENTSLKFELTLLAQNQCDIQCNKSIEDEDPVVKTILGVCEEASVMEKAPAAGRKIPASKSNLEIPLSKLEITSSKLIQNEEPHSSVSSDRITKLDFSLLDSLSLLEDCGAFSEPAEGPTTEHLTFNADGKPDDNARDDFTLSNIDESILLDSEWELYSKKDVSSSKEEEAMFKSSHHSEAQVSSPDDWIDVGSPLVESSSKLGFSAPVDLKKATAGRLSDDNNSASSSSCSVDGCYDFDSFVQNWPGSPDAPFSKEPPLFPHLSSVFHSGYTDIDELD